MPSSSSSWPTAVLGLLAFVILPLVAQIHFLRNFHDEGYVYVYPGSFGYDTKDPEFAGQTCFTDSIPVCTKKDAGRYSLAAAKPGSACTRSRCNEAGTLRTADEEATNQQGWFRGRCLFVPFLGFSLHGLSFFLLS